MNRTARIAALTVVALLALASPAMAADGVGLWGPASDKDITMWGFAVIGLFTALVIILSYVQHRLETRKERAREEIERLRSDLSS